VNRSLATTAALLLALLPLQAAAQEQPVGPSQDAAWHNAQQLALASRQASDGWQWMEGGLLWRRVAGDGSGKHPTLDVMVTIHYAGTFIDGTEFDSSYRRNEPATFPLNGVIPCWTEGVQLMKVGGKSRLVCPSSLAYGDRGAPPDIKPGATLVFEVELLNIEKSGG
jgi:FKBP-type peptidyl-prolyl cis-trans isomerase